MAGNESIQETLTSEGITLTIDTEELEGKVLAAFERYTRRLEAQFTKEISRKQFDWPAATRRGKGDGAELIQTGKRDLIDSGAFRQSIQRRKTGSGSYRFTWNVPYSLYILKGYQTKNNQWPARNWISKALKRLPPLPTLKSMLAKK